MDLTITKEKVLEAAGKCSTAKATLQVLFPEVFRDDYAIKEGVFNDSQERTLEIFSQKAFGVLDALQILNVPTTVSRNPVHRALYIHSRYDVELQSTLGGGTAVIIKYASRT